MVEADIVALLVNKAILNVLPVPVVVVVPPPEPLWKLCIPCQSSDLNEVAIAVVIAIIVSLKYQQCLTDPVE